MPNSFFSHRMRRIRLVVVRNIIKSNRFDASCISSWPSFFPCFLISDLCRSSCSNGNLDISHEAPRSGAPNWVLGHIRSLQNSGVWYQKKSKNLENARTAWRARVCARVVVNIDAAICKVLFRIIKWKILENSSVTLLFRLRVIKNDHSGFLVSFLMQIVGVCGCARKNKSCNSRFVRKNN